MKWITEDVAAVVRPRCDVVVAPINIAKQPWHRESAIGGAYAFYRPGQWFSVRKALQRPHQRVHFAGEHLSEEWQGFMEGAVESGQAAANCVMSGS
jgi:monoamine oxidase